MIPIHVDPVARPGGPPAVHAHAHAHAPRELTLADIRHAVGRQRYLVMGIVAGIMALTALYTWTKRPEYETVATLRIDDKKKSGVSLLGDLGALTGGGGDVLETEVFVLQSRQIAEAVADSTHLQVSLAKPNVPRASVLRVVSARRDAAPGSYEFTRAGQGSYRVAPVGEGVKLGATSAAVGQPFALPGVEVVLLASAPQRFTLDVAEYAEVVDQLRRSLDVRRPNPGARAVTVTYRNTDPLITAAVPNAAMASFIRYESGAAHTETSSMVGFLRQQVASYDTQLREAEAQVRAYREQQRVVSPKDEATEEVHRLAELQAQRDEVLSQRNSLSSLLDQAAQHSAEGTSRYRQLASYPQFLTNRAVQDILQSITTLENQRSELSVRRSGENLDVQRFDRRISELEMELFRIAQSYRQSLDTQLASLNANLAQFGARLGGIPAREIEFARLARQQKLLEEIATLLQTRLKEAEIQEAVVPGDIRIIDPALVPRRPVAPRPVLNMALGLIFGMLLGTGAAFLREALDRKIRDREQVDVLTGGVPVLGTIPRFTPVAALPASSGSGRALAAPQDVLGASLVTQREPRGPVAEAYRALRTSLTFARRMGKQQVIVVTSAMPGDGKSTSASNLAITLAQQGTRTLLVDADLRKGLLHGIFGLRQDPGLAHVLLGRSSVEDVLQSVPVEGSDTPLHFLASGVFPPNPAELLGSDAVEELMRELRSAYDVIIIDAPPLNLVTDAALLSRVADATVLVVRVGVTERAALQHAIAQLRQLQTPLSGVVLNDVDVRAGHYYGYYGVDT